MIARWQQAGRRFDDQWHTAVVCFVLVVLAVVGLTSCETPPTAVLCTNICVAEPFETFYQENGSTRIFGSPHTLPYADVATERTVQYFDNARLEHDAETGNITIFPLGAWAFAGLDDQEPLAVPEGGRQMTLNGYVVQGSFLDFYEANGSDQVFGLPISDQLDEGELRVQYFENVRLEWHPEAPSDRQVQVGPLGRAHYLYVVYSPLDEEQRFIPSDDARPTAVEVTAAVSFPILYEGQSQIVFVVTEANGRQPVAGLSVELLVEHGEQSYIQSLEQQTSDLGTVQAELSLQNLAPGEEVVVTVRVRDPQNDNRLIGTTSITFQTWW